MKMSRSQELYDTWKENGGNLEQYDYPTEINNERGYTTWHFSRVRRSFSAKDGVIENMAERDADERSHLYFKHRGTDTWMHIKSGTGVVVGAQVGFRAWVTVNGQHLTVGEYHVSTDPEKVIEWAVEWMENHPDGYED
jgi:hypothetical protein